MIMGQIEKILMERDNMSLSDAKDLVDETRELILQSDILEADDIMADMLCLEPDYIIDLIGY
jgi:hypothetical protein